MGGEFPAKVAHYSQGAHQVNAREYRLKPWKYLVFFIVLNLK